MKTVGIIGFGSFGSFLARQLDPYCSVKVHARREVDAKWSASLQEVAKCDYVVLSIPLSVYPEMLRKLKPELSTTSVVVDVCSVKMEPVQLIKNILPKQPLLATHPLFGPESAEASLSGHTLVVCPEDSDSTSIKELTDFVSNLGIEIVFMSAQEHDKEMAVVHGLTFFIAHALKDFGLHDQKLSTPSFKKLLALVQLEKHHTYDLFLTIQRGNPMTKEVREQFISVAKGLHEKI